MLEFPIQTVKTTATWKYILSADLHIANPTLDSTNQKRMKNTHKFFDGCIFHDGTETIISSLSIPEWIMFNIDLTSAQIYIC